MRREEEAGIWRLQRMPKTFRPMITISGTPQSQRMMLFMIEVSVR
jgi:hypothetical protein